MTPAKKILIIGGGLSGLTLAYRLNQYRKQTNRALEVQILEASERLGGIIHSEHQEGFLIEHGADSFFSEKIWALDLAEELGLEKELLSPNKRHAKSFIYSNGKLKAAPKGLHLFAPTNTLSFLVSPLLSFKGKLRALAEPWIRKKKNSEDESLASFVRRRFGDELYEKIAQPMLGGIYSGDPESLSLRATFERFHQMEQEYGSVLRALRASKKEKTNENNLASGPRYHKFISFRGGMKTLIYALKDKLESLQISTHTEAAEILYNNGWKIKTKGNHEDLEADFLCLATSSTTAAKLLRTQLPETADKLASIPHESAASLNLGFERSQFKHLPQGFGFVVPKESPTAIIGATFASTKFKHRAPFRKVLIRVFAGGAFHRSLFEKSEEEIQHQVIEELRTILPFSGEPILKSYYVHKQAMPQYDLEHSKKIEQLQSTPLPLYLMGNYFSGVGLPDVIRKANIVAGEIIEELEKEKPDAVPCGEGLVSNPSPRDGVR